MANAETETIIPLNDGDMEQGFFRFYTSKRWAWDRVIKIVGGDLLEIAWSLDRAGKVVACDLKIPILLLLLEY